LFEKPAFLSDKITTYSYFVVHSKTAHTSFSTAYTQKKTVHRVSLKIYFSVLEFCYREKFNPHLFLKRANIFLPTNKCFTAI